jgi:hypothetical protein
MKVMHRRTAQFLRVFGVGLALASLGPFANAQSRPNPPNPLSIVGGSTVPDGSSATFFDNFEYNVGRSDSNARTTFMSHGWTGVKTNQMGDTGNGYLYTATSIPGYSGSMPSGSRVLVVEALPRQLAGNEEFIQTDFYLQLGREDGPRTAIPANVWFQFWIYQANTAQQPSRFARRNKWLYPCRSFYPCQNEGWLFQLGSGGFQPTDGPLANQYLGLSDTHDIDYTLADEYPTNRFKLFQNRSTQQIIANQWTLVKLHMDTSGAQGRYEGWIKPRGGQWTKVAEWIAGQTPGLNWNIPAGERRGGHSILRMPTTVNEYDSWTYMDDFAMATSEAALPQYP